MKNLFQKFVKVCPKSGRIRGFTFPGGYYKILYPIIGFVALLWILMRVIPKPSRANYPCIKAATPFAYGFIVYIASLIVSALAFARTKKKIYLSPYFVSICLAIFGFSDSSHINKSLGSPGYPLPKSVHVANNPIGEAKGIFPGRVVWVYDPAATNENCIPNSVDHAWWMQENNDQNVIDGMVSKAIQTLTGTATDSEAWDAIFKYHNTTRGKGSVSYSKGEKIFIKVNIVSGWYGNYNTTDLSVVENGSYGISETSPEITLSVLRQLVNVVEVAQSDIYVGDPLRNIYKHSYDMWQTEFPNVHYMGHDNYSNLGREQLVADTIPEIFYSDKGTVLRENVWDTNRLGGDTVTSDCFYTAFEDAEYLLNIPMLKGHKRAGMTMFAKNHFGSHTRADASHLHMGLVDPIEIEYDISRRDYGMYRVQVDMMSSKMLGGKTLFYLMDALWPSDQEISYPKKFAMQPFNNDWMSSVFASLDPVAIESVGYDFLRSEFTSTRSISDGAGTYVQKPAADDYLHQAADSSQWAEGIKYNPDNDGKYFASLGVHEHWNNEIDKQYSRNLGTGNGIELIDAINFTDVEKESSLPADFYLSQNYPNPFNPSTRINYSIPTASKVVIKIYDVTGKEIATLVNSEKAAGTYTVSFNAKQLASGVYYYRLTANNYTATKKFILLK
jgi:hypothetical protein